MRFLSYLTAAISLFLVAVLVIGSFANENGIGAWALRVGSGDVEFWKSIQGLFAEDSANVEKELRLQKLEGFMTDPRFALAFLAVISISYFLGTRWFVLKREDFGKKFRDFDKTDRYVMIALRERAYFLKLLGWIFLIIAVFFLLSGLYFVLFLAPEISSRDEIVVLQGKISEANKVIDKSEKDERDERSRLRNTLEHSWVPIESLSPAGGSQAERDTGDAGFSVIGHLAFQPSQSKQSNEIVGLAVGHKVEGGADNLLLTRIESSGRGASSSIVRRDVFQEIKVEDVVQGILNHVAFSKDGGSAWAVGYQGPKFSRSPLLLEMSADGSNPKAVKIAPTAKSNTQDVSDATKDASDVVPAAKDGADPSAENSNNPDLGGTLFHALYSDKDEAVFATGWQGTSQERRPLIVKMKKGSKKPEVLQIDPPVEIGEVSKAFIAPDGSVWVLGFEEDNSSTRPLLLRRDGNDGPWKRHVLKGKDDDPIDGLLTHIDGVNVPLATDNSDVSEGKSGVANAASQQPPDTKPGVADAPVGQPTAPAVIWAVGEQNLAEQTRALFLRYSEDGSWTRETAEGFEGVTLRKVRVAPNGEQAWAVGRRNEGSRSKPVIAAWTPDGGWVDVLSKHEIFGELNDIEVEVDKDGAVGRVWAVGSTETEGSKPLIYGWEKDGTWKQGHIYRGRETGSLRDIAGFPGSGEFWAMGDFQMPRLLKLRDMSGEIAQIRTEEKEGKNTFTDVEFQKVRAYLSDDGSPPTLQAFAERYVSLEVSIKSQTSLIEQFQKQIDSIRYGTKIDGVEGEVGDRDDPFVRTQELNILLTRILTVIITFFIVHLMIGLFRYNYRLAGFYEARADAIILATRFGAQNQKVSMKDLIASLSPDGMDFGRTPRALVEHATEMAKGMVNKSTK